MPCFQLETCNLHSLTKGAFMQSSRMSRIEYGTIPLSVFAAWRNTRRSSVFSIVICLYKRSSYTYRKSSPRNLSLIYDLRLVVAMLTSGSVRCQQFGDKMSVLIFPLKLDTPGDENTMILNIHTFFFLLFIHWLMNCFINSLFVYFVHLYYVLFLSHSIPFHSIPKAHFYHSYSTPVSISFLFHTYSISISIELLFLF